LRLSLSQATNLREVCLTLEPQGHDLLLKMLEMNPIARISAAEALAHPYFDNVRLPEGMPKYVNPEPKGSQKSKRR
jgi:serine/threonine protein kinase